MNHEPQAQAAGTFSKRRRMVEEHLRPRGITDLRVIEAMNMVPREDFVPGRLRDAAYDDSALPIGYDQTISQPFTVAHMCQALQLRGNEKVLEIGTGSGYGAAVLSHLARQVFTIERIPELADEARERLRRLGYRNVRVIIGDGTLGLPSDAPFDGIIVTAGAELLPHLFAQQLRDGGRIVIPIGVLSYGQIMHRFTRHGDELIPEELGTFSFVPLIGEHG